MSKSQFAAGKKALGICDRCGWTWKLKKLRKETVNLTQHNILVCPNCFDPDHPQNMAGRIDYMDPQALRNPRIDTDPGTGDGHGENWEFIDTFSPWLAPVLGDPLDLIYAEGGFVKAVNGSANTQMFALATAGNPISVDADKYTILRMRVRWPRLVSSPTWVGEFKWARDTDVILSGTSTHVEPTTGTYENSQWVFLEWDLSGEANWNGTVDSATIKLFSDNTTITDFNYIRFEVS